MMVYSVKEVAGFSGVSVRTLHHYDSIGLLKPALRKKSGYRYYGEQELLKLQQILFYKELEFSLQDISKILNDRSYDLIEALESQKVMLDKKKRYLENLLKTMEKTIVNVKNENAMSTPEELYAGFSKEAKKYRNEAIDKYGKEEVERSEKEIMQLGKTGLNRFKEDFDKTWKTLFQMRHEDPASTKVQVKIAHHYELILKAWGKADQADKQLESYACLGDLYVNDERFTTIDGTSYPDFGIFM